MRENIMARPRVQILLYDTETDDTTAASSRKKTHAAFDHFDAIRPPLSVNHVSGTALGVQLYGIINTINNMHRSKRLFARSAKYDNSKR